MRIIDYIVPTCEGAVDIPAPPLPVSRGPDVQPEVEVVGERGDDAVLPAPVAAVAVLKQRHCIGSLSSCPDLVGDGRILEGGGPKHLAAQVPQLVGE